MTKKSHPKNIMAKCFNQEYYNALTPDQQSRLLQCCSSGIVNTDSAMGCYAMNPNDYDEFKDFFKAALESYHNVDLSVKSHTNNWDLDKVEGDFPEGNILDVSKFGLGALSMRIRTARNLKNFPLPGSMSKQQRIDLEIAMGEVFQTLIDDPKFGGKYVSLTPGHKNQMSDDEYKALVKAHIMFKDMSNDSYLLAAGIAAHWPFGRGCYVSEDKGFIIWLGEEDHLRIMCMKKSVIINEVFDRLKAAIDVVEKLIPGGCAKSETFGVVTSCPTNIGTGMRASVHIQLPKLTSDGTDKQVKKLCDPFGLSVRGLGGEHTPIGSDGTVDISPRARFCISEAEIAGALYQGVKKVWDAETNA